MLPIVSLIHQRYHSIVSDEAGTIVQSHILPTHPEVSILAPAVAPRIPEFPVVLAMGGGAALDLLPPCFALPLHCHLPKANQSNSVVRSAELRAPTNPVPVVNDSADVVFYALVDSEGDSDYALAGEFFEVARSDVVVDFEIVDFEKYWSRWHLVASIIVQVIFGVEPALFLFIPIPIVL